MFKKILFATDGSEYAEIAEKYAIKLAKDENGEITAINVRDISYATIPTGMNEGVGLQSSIGDIIENEKKSGEEILNKFKENAERENVKANTIVKIGRPDKEIIEESKNGYDVIVIGSKGLTGIKRYLLGSVAEHVVRYAEIPVLVVKSKKEDDTFR